MTIKENPFYILGATPRDNRQKIQELVDEKSLELDSSVCVEARAVLTNPRRRLSAELSWFPGVSVRQIKTVVKELEDKELTPETLERLPALAGFNAILAYLVSDIKFSVKQLENVIFALAQNYDAVTAEKAMTVINEDRSVSGFPEVSDITIVQEEITELKNDVMHNLQNVLSSLGLEKLNKLMLSLMERCEKQKKTYVLLDDIIDNVYALEIQKNLDSIKSKVTDAIEVVRKAPKTKMSAAVDSLISELKTFDDIMQPIQLSTQKRGLEHDVTKEVAYAVRKLCLGLGNKDMLNYAEKITAAMNDLFKEVDSIEELTSNDLEQIKQIQLNEKAHAKEIECTITHSGAFDSKELSISAKGISYGADSYKLEDITSIRYGLIINSDYTINTFVAFGTDTEETQIKWLEAKLRGEDDFHKFTGCLWKAVGVRLLRAMITQLALGKSLYGFIYDTKVILDRSGYGEDKSFKWPEVSVKTEGGKLIIQAINDYRYRKELSLIQVENAVVLSILLQIFKESAQGTSISQAYGVSKEDAKYDKQIKFPDEIQEREAPTYVNWGAFFASTWWIWLILIIWFISAIAE